MGKNIAITPAEFKRRLDKGEVSFIFDLRNKEDFEAWRVEGRGPIETLNIPQMHFVAEEEKYLGRFPKDRQIVAICPHGDSSRYSAELLSENGFDAVSLEGGIDAWSEYYEATKASDDPAVYQVLRVAKGCLSYLIASGGEAAVIDPPRHTSRILELADKLGVRITRVLDTHLHADHVSGGRDLAAAAGAEYLLNPEDAGGATYVFTALADGQVIPVGGSRIAVIHSPGHTPGSTSFLLDGKYLFTGDTIMKGSVGRPDLGGLAQQWAVMLHKTLFERFASLPDGAMVLPAHSASMAEQDSRSLICLTLGEARGRLDLFKTKDLGQFIDRVRHSLLHNPERYKDIRKVNLGAIPADEPYKKELEIGKNLCGMATRKA
jgi:glyoxylase-like metal-dependent hydrolase (beta-lactamase superfamily II)/rhodanese-related sulfurtransferase